MTQAQLEWIGYGASAIIAGSLLVTNVWWFRRINFVGAALFCLYGILIKATPVALMNGLIAVINVFFIIQMMNKVDYFHYITVTWKESKYLQYFLRYYVRDIGHHFPRFFPEKLSPDQKYTFVLRNAVSVGVFSYHIDGDTGVIDLDYVIPAYRDLKNTRYLIRDALAERFRAEKIGRLRVYSTEAKYVKHIRKLGFREIDGQPNAYELKLPMA